MTPRPHVIITALLFGYLTLERQSNLVVTGQPPGLSHHILKRYDVKLLDNAVLVRSTKTRSATAPPVVFCLPAIPLSPCCPVTGWTNYLQTVTHLPANGLAFVLPNGTYLTAKTHVCALRIVSLTIFQEGRNYTLQSKTRSDSSMP